MRACRRRARRVRQGRRVPGRRRLRARRKRASRAAIDPDSDSTAVIAYLAAAYAAAGHDSEAAGAWQTALIEGSDLPQIYRWLGDALLRTRDVGQARAVLEEAIAKWPSDLALRASRWRSCTPRSARAREAVRTLERYLAGNPNDTEAHVHGASSGCTSCGRPAPPRIHRPKT